MFLTTNNEVIGSLKSPSAMVFRRKLTVCPPASRLLLPFVSSELGKNNYFIPICARVKTIKPSLLWMTLCTVFSLVHLCHLVIHNTSGVSTRSSPLLHSHVTRQTFYLAASRCRKSLFDFILYVPVNNFSVIFGI